MLAQNLGHLMELLDFAQNLHKSRTSLSCSQEKEPLEYGVLFEKIKEVLSRQGICMHLGGHYFAPFFM